MWGPSKTSLGRRRSVLQAERRATGPCLPNQHTLDFSPPQAFGVPLRHQLCTSLSLCPSCPPCLQCPSFQVWSLCQPYSSAEIQCSFSVKSTWPLLPNCCAKYRDVDHSIFWLHSLTPDAPLLFPFPRRAATLILVLILYSFRVVLVRNKIEKVQSCPIYPWPHTIIWELRAQPVNWLRHFYLFFFLAVKMNLTCLPGFSHICVNL